MVGWLKEVQELEVISSPKLKTRLWGQTAVKKGEEASGSGVAFLGEKKRFPLGMFPP